MSNDSERELLRKWVTALRSGKYKQGQYTLRDANDKYCCLGVLCDISGVGTWKSPHPSEYTGYSHNGNMTSPSSEVAKKVTRLFRNIDQCEFMTFNDSLKLTFDEIADIIDIYLEETKTPNSETFNA